MLLALLGSIALIGRGDASTPQDGFGGAATGGDGALIYRVKNLKDSGSGSLRAGAQATKPRSIVFDVSGTINLLTPIQVASNKTIDGKNKDVTIAGKGFVVQNASNIIIRNLALVRAVGETEDAIRILERAHTIRIEHCDFSSWGDGLIDITRAGTDVTVSWNRFHNHNKVMLIDPLAWEGAVRVTLHHNFFEGTRERHPLGRTSQIHAYNNYLRSWTAYGMGAGTEAQLLSEANIYEAGEYYRKCPTLLKKCAVLVMDYETARVRSKNDWLLNGAVANENRPLEVFNPSLSYLYTAEPADDALRQKILSGAGRNL